MRFDFFKVIAERQSYMNLLYLLLSFPLGIFYFVFLVVGLSLGFGLFITLLGIPILILVLILSRVFARVEVILTNELLEMEIEIEPFVRRVNGFWDYLKRLLTDAGTWKDMGYLFLKFPMGIINFVFTVTLIAVTVAFLSVPFVYRISGLHLSLAVINNFNKAMLLFVFGIFVGILSLHILNGLAYLNREFARVMLAGKTEEKKGNSKRHTGSKARRKG